MMTRSITKRLTIISQAAPTLSRASVLEAQATSTLKRTTSLAAGAFGQFGVQGSGRTSKSIGPGFVYMGRGDEEKPNKYQEFANMQATLRITLPLRIQQLWDCFTNQGPTLDIDKFIAQAASLHKLSKDTVTDDLENAIKDGLIIAEMSQEKGNEVEVYKLPDFPIQKGDHDWYCFRCHLGGPVVKCEDCPRVFHLECLPDDRKPHKDLFVCPSCHLLSTKPSTEKMGLKPKQLNTLITYILDRFREWKIDELDKADAKIWVTRVDRPAKESWRFDCLVYTPIDLTIMYEKASSGNYKSIEEFQVDCETLYHDIATFFGIEATKGSNIGAAFHRDITHEINEVMLCHDCFRLSNEKNHAWWFCLPCATPHEVVFAKQTGYPFWPAKVMKKEGSKYDVRYFGGNYERAIIDAKNIMPIDTPISQLKIRKNATWNEAFDELQKFQEIARNPDLVNSLPASKGKSTPAKATPKSAVKRPATEPAKVSTSKKSKIDHSANATPARSASAKASTSNGVSDVRKKIIRNSSTPAKAPLARRENSSPASSSASPMVATKRADSTGSGDKFLVPETIEEIQSTIDSFFKSSRDGTSNIDVNYSDDEDDKVSDKASEDAVSSSVNESGSSRNAYVQTNTEFIIPKESKNKIQNFILAMKDAYYQEIAANKKKQWCYNCEREAIYHCCWNTAYCSTDCQQAHWTKEHKKQCRRDSDICDLLEGDTNENENVCDNNNLERPPPRLRPQVPLREINQQQSSFM